MSNAPPCYAGSPWPPPPRRILRAGPLSAVYEAGDLRYLKLGAVEVCRRWYAAVRGADWGTVPGVISDEVIEESGDGFRVSYTSRHRRGEIDFVWRASIEGTPSRVRFEFDGEALGEFRANRVGFCVLHPVRECAGRSATLTHADGTASVGRFPELIAPDNPFRDLVGLAHGLPGGPHAAWSFEGDSFETEDQRNWIDASFKTFCTPLSRPFPVTLRPGDRVRQAVTLELSAAAAVVGAADEGPVVFVGDDTHQAHAWPQLGVDFAPGAGPPTHGELGRLRVLKLNHLRAEIDLSRPGWAETLRAADRLAQQLKVELVLAVVVSDAAWDETAALTPEAVRLSSGVCQVHAFHADRWGAAESIFTPVVEALARASIMPDSPLGTRGNFAELNRGRPPACHRDGATFSIQPQEHASDDASLAETLGAIGDTIASARAFASGPFHVGPITLKKRVNPYATGPTAPSVPGQMPATIDPRQMSLFGAGWTLGAVAALAGARAECATFYEALGPRGLMEREAGGDHPDQFPSRPGQVFPLYHVFADLADINETPVEVPAPSRPLELAALRFDLTLLLANLTPRPLAVQLDSLGESARLRLLDETTYDAACLTPEDWRRDGYTELATGGGTTTLTLRPYAYARLDWQS